MIALAEKRGFSFQLITIGTLLAFMWAFLLPCESTAQQKVETPVGTTVVLKTNTTLTPEQLKVGDTVEFSVVSDVVVNGEVVIKAGARARGEITVSKERNYIGIAAKIGFAVKSVQAVDGTMIPLSGIKLSEGKDKMVMSIGLSLVCCVLFALKKGGEAFIQAGTPIEATVSATTPVAINPEMNYKPKEETVDIVPSISEGTVAYIGAVLINWVSETSDEPHKTKEYVIRRELERYNIEEGKLYSSQNIEDARRRILNLGPFIKRADPKIDLEPQSSEPGKKNEPQKVTVNIDVEESRRSMMFGVAGGYGSEGSLFGSLDIRDDNILGRALRMQLRGEIGTQERRTGEVVFSTPWVLNTPTSLYASLYSRRRTTNYSLGVTDTTSSDDNPAYRDDSVGASATVGHPIARNFDLSLSLRNEKTTYKQWDDTQNRYVTLQEWYRNNINQDYDPSKPEYITVTQSLSPAIGKTRSIKLQLARDTRNYLTSMFDPNSGTYNTASVEVSGLGGDRFQRYETESSLFVPTWWKLVLVFHLQTGYIAGKDFQYLRYERYYLGGIRSVRGYALNSITPPGEYELYGGNRMGQLNIEYRIPITSMFRGIVFFDAGQTWGGDQKIFKDFAPRKSVGVGIRFDFLGALARIEYGIPLDPPVKGEKRGSGRFEFDIGPSFRILVF